MKRADARAGVERRQDEQRLEHDREVVPEREHSARRARCEKICAMPTASVGAPPVRANSVVLAHLARRACSICSAVTGKPQPLIVAAAASAVAPTTPAGLLIAK